MQDSYEMFLLVAEELNFTRAAKRAFVAQQTASYHISSLEEEYGILLFNRKPSLSLTEAGRLFYDNIKNIKAMELSLKQQILEIKEESVGEIRIGINNVRGRILLAKILRRYLIKYPKVKTSFFINDTKILAKMLLDNKIDLFLGVDTESNEVFNKIKLKDEKMFFIATREFLLHQANLTCEDIDKALKEGISLLDLDGLPTARNKDECMSNEIINRAIKRLDINLPIIISTSDYDMQIMFCGKSLSGAFCPTMILHRVLDHNKNNPDDKEILVFDIKELNENLRLDIVTSSIIPIPKYLDVFIKDFIHEVNNSYNSLVDNKKMFK